MPDPPEQAHQLLPASPILRGDWVLFHPVYTQEELKAVEVNRVLPYVSTHLSSRITDGCLLPVQIGHVPRGQNLSG